MNSQPATGPNVDPAEVQKFDALASRWWDPKGEFKPLHQLNPVRLDYVVARAGVTNKSCADVGCGGGLLSEGLAERGATDVTGIDMAEGPLTVAKLHLQKSGHTNIDYRQSSAEELAQEQAGAFDIVTCMEVIEHVPDPVVAVVDVADAGTAVEDIGVEDGVEAVEGVVGEHLGILALDGVR